MYIIVNFIFICLTYKNFFYTFIVVINCEVAMEEFFGGILGIGIGVWFIFWITGSLPSQVKEKEDEEKHLKECMDKHFNTLMIKAQQKIYTDDYGRAFYDDWIREIEFFIKNIVFPNEDYSGSIGSMLLEARMIQFDAYWKELVTKHLDDIENNTINIVVKNGLDYELYVEKYLQNLGYNVTRTPKTGDQGVDLIAEKDEDRKAIQCKYYSKPVGNKAVQEVIAGANFYSCTSAAVISNSSFAKSARQLAKNSDIELLSLIPQ